MENTVVRDLTYLAVEMINNRKNSVGSGSFLKNLSGTCEFLPRVFGIISRIKDLRAELSHIDLGEVATFVQDIAKIDLPGEKADVLKQSIADAAVSILTGLAHMDKATAIVAEAKGA